MSRLFLFLLALSITGSAHAACQRLSWNEKWFDADAIHYAAGDLDGDGVPEIIAASATTVTYRRPPQFDPFTVYSATAIDAPMAGDVTGDGKTDLLIPNTANKTLVVLPGNGNGTFNSAVITSLSVTPSRFVLGNFSGNAHVDVALIGSASSLIFLQGNGTGAFTPVGTVPVAASPFRLTTANFDGDGYDDVAVSHATSNTVEIVYANGSGGAAASWTLQSGSSALLAAADHDSDGDIDLYSITSSAFAVFPNVGSRKFDAAMLQPAGWPAPPRSIELVDFDNDLDLDLAVGSAGFLTWIIRAPESTGGWNGYSIKPHPLNDANSLRSMAAADFTGDGRIDLAFENADAGYGGLIINECGQASVGIVTQNPKISVGQIAEASVSVYSGQDPVPTGTVKLTWNGGEHTLPLTSGSQRAFASYTLPTLPLGFQPIVADYSGDETYPPAASTWWLTVTTATTSTSLTGPSRWIYGERPKFNAVVTSSDGDTVTGDLNFYRDGAYSKTEQAPAAEWTVPILKAGSHTITARLGFSETHPPSSDSNDVTIDKATSEMGLQFGAMSRDGASAWIKAWLRPQFYAPMTGSLYLEEGETTLRTASLNPYLSNQSPEFLFTGLALGPHTLRLVYPGDENLHGTSFEFEHVVLPADTGVRLMATGDAASVRLDVLPLAGASHRVYRRTAETGWAYVEWLSSRDYTDSDVIPGTTYQYRIEAVTNNAVVSQSNIETVYVGPFTDANLSGVKIKKLHFTEVQTALNTFRTMASLPLLQIDFTGTIKAAHIVQMRNYVNEARTALGMSAISFGADPVGRVTRIRGADLHQLRDALR